MLAGQEDVNDIGPIPFDKPRLLQHFFFQQRQRLIEFTTGGEFISNFENRLGSLFPVLHTIQKCSIPQPCYAEILYAGVDCWLRAFLMVLESVPNMSGLESMERFHEQLLLAKCFLLRRSSDLAAYLQLTRANLPSSLLRIAHILSDGAVVQGILAQITLLTLSDQISLLEDMLIQPTLRPLLVPLASKITCNSSRELEGEFNRLLKVTSKLIKYEEQGLELFVGLVTSNLLSTFTNQFSMDIMMQVLFSSVNSAVFGTICSRLRVVFRTCPASQSRALQESAVVFTLKALQAVPSAAAIKSFAEALLSGKVFPFTRDQENKPLAQLLAVFIKLHSVEFSSELVQNFLLQSSAPMRLCLYLSLIKELADFDWQNVVTLDLTVVFKDDCVGMLAFLDGICERCLPASRAGTVSLSTDFDLPEDLDEEDLLWNLNSQPQKGSLDELPQGKRFSVYDFARRSYDMLFARILKEFKGLQSEHPERFARLCLVLLDQAVLTVAELMKEIGQGLMSTAMDCSSRRRVLAAFYANLCFGFDFKDSAVMTLLCRALDPRNAPHFWLRCLLEDASERHAVRFVSANLSIAADAVACILALRVPVKFMTAELSQRCRVLKPDADVLLAVALGYADACLMETVLTICHGCRNVQSLYAMVKFFHGIKAPLLPDPFFQGLEDERIGMQFLRFLPEAQFTVGEFELLFSSAVGRYAKLLVVAEALVSVYAASPDVEEQRKVEGVDRIWGLLSTASDDGQLKVLGLLRKFYSLARVSYVTVGQATILRCVMHELIVESRSESIFVPEFAEKQAEVCAPAMGGLMTPACMRLALLEGPLVQYGSKAEAVFGLMDELQDMLGNGEEYRMFRMEGRKWRGGAG